VEGQATIGSIRDAIPKKVPADREIATHVTSHFFQDKGGDLEDTDAGSSCRDDPRAGARKGSYASNGVN